MFKEKHDTYCNEDIYAEIYFSSNVSLSHPDIDQTAYMDARKNTKKLHVQVFLRMNTWMFETCRRQYN
jgi:hypothetical protein